ncbi:MAG: Hsp20/alpha crystallin family protein [Planctomycetes bacterium]|nr:Hsp20/alpha crystallin family protein [Planctomycetota bacterium]
MADETAIEKRETQDVHPTERMRAGRTYVPNVDILENDQKLMLLADMPGVKADDLDIRYEHGELSVHGHVQPRQDTQGNYLLREYGVGDFYRSFQVGEGIDPTGIEAELRDGVLMLHLPKTEQAVPRKISVKTK